MLWSAEVLTDLVQDFYPLPVFLGQYLSVLFMLAAWWSQLQGWRSAGCRMLGLVLILRSLLVVLHVFSELWWVGMTILTSCC